MAMLVFPKTVVSTSVTLFLPVPGTIPPVIPSAVPLPPASPATAATFPCAATNEAANKAEAMIVPEKRMSIVQRVSWKSERKVSLMMIRQEIQKTLRDESIVRNDNGAKIEKMRRDKKKLKARLAQLMIGD